MKHKIVLVLLVAVLALTCAVTVNAATIKEDTSTYAGNGDVYIIGSSKFTNNIVITGKMIGVAGARETVIQYMIYNNYDFDPDDLQIYYYNDLTKTWKELPETSEDTIRNLTEAETEALTNDLKIYYENQQEKTIEVPYELNVTDGYKVVGYDGAGNEVEIKYEDGKLQIPATTSYLEVCLVNEEDSKDVVLLDAVVQDEDGFEITSTVINSLAELKAAIAAEKTDIRLNADIVGITETITIPYFVNFNGAGHKLAFENIQKTSTSSVASGLVISGNYSTVQNLTIEMDGKAGWQGNYAMQVYGATGVFVENYTGTKADAALLVNGSSVRLNGKIDVSGNEFGGIEVSRGSNANLENSSLSKLDNEKIVMTGESISKPVVWLEKDQGAVNILTLVANENVPAYAGKSQVYYYSNENVYKNLEVSTYSELKMALEVEGVENVKLLNDITLDAVLVVNKIVTLDLNGHTIKNETDLWNKDTKAWSLISVRKGGNLTVTGNGTLKAKENDCYAIDLQEGGIVTIENGTFVGNISAVYVKEGDLTVNGGTYSIQQLGSTNDERYTLNCLDANYQAGIARITVKGGTFVKYNPAANLAEINGADFVEDGCKVVVDGDNFTVKASEETDTAVVDGVTYSTLADAVAAAKAGETVTLIKDTTLDAVLVVNKKITLDLNGHTINNEVDLWNIQNEAKDWSLISVRAGGKLTVTGNGTLKAKENDCYAIDLQEGGIVTIENGTFVGNISAVYVKEGDLTVNGGTYSIQQLGSTNDERYTLNCLDANYQAGIARITVKGGTFVKYNPAANLAEINGADFVPDGYKVVENGDNYTVEVDN